MGIPRVVQTFPTIAFTSAFALLSAPVAAQVQDSFAAPAHIDFLEGQSSLEREGQIEPADAGALFIPGDRLRTTAGRVEVVFPDGSVLDIDEHSSVDLQDVALLRLTSGRLLLTVAGANDPAAATLYQIDTPVASVATEGPGEYRIAVLSNPAGLVTELAVSRGAASLSTELGTMPLRAGQRSLAREFESPSYPQIFNSARLDAFDEWAAVQREARLGTAGSNQYLPEGLQMYGGALDRSGSWSYHSSHGYVWYPAVGATWRPYYTGYWNAIRPYGWTWIGADPWAWPTHHYGRWGYGGSRWYWIPHNRWGPAWVSWGVSGGYVGWSPLGFNDRPLFDLSVSIGNRWNGWVVVPNRYFNARRTRVRHHAIAPYRLSAETFVTQSVAPVAPHYAVPRHRDDGTMAAASGRAESAGAQTREGARRSAATTSRRPLALARTPGAAARPQGTAPASAARTAGTAAQRNPRATVRPGSSVRGSSATGSVRRSAPVARQQPAARARQPIGRAPRASTAARPATAGATSGSDGRPPRTAVARSPRESSAGRQATPGPTTGSLGRPPSGTSERNSSSSLRGSTRRRGDGVRSDSGRSQQPAPTAVTRQPTGSTRGQAGSTNPRASRPSATSRRATAPQSRPRSTNRSGSSPAAPQQASSGARARAPRAQTPSGGRTTAPARAVSRNPGRASSAGSPGRSRAQPSSGSTPARAPASRRGR